MSTHPICECSLIYCGCRGLCAEPATDSYWLEWEFSLEHLCSNCRQVGDRPVIREEGSAMAKKSWFLAENQRGEMTAIFASTLEEAEKLAGVYPWEKGDRVTVRAANENEARSYNLREVLL